MVQSIQRLPSRGRISMVKIQNFTIERRQSVIPLIYGTLLIIIALVMASISPLEKITAWFLSVEEGSFVYKMWQKPTYDLYCDVWIFNYTNVPEYMSGEDKVLKMEDIGPFRYKEQRTNHNITINHETGRMIMRPNINLSFVPQESFGHTKDVFVNVPNIALIAISTLAADKLGYIANAGAYYSMTAIGSELFLNISAEDYLWGYHDPIVTIANNILPGWIDFGKLGIMDRFYGQKMISAEVEIGVPEKRYEIQKWDGYEGLRERGFTDLNSSTLCNRIKGSYEGLMISTDAIRDKKIPIFRKQACRVFPFTYLESQHGEHGFDYQRFTIEENAFNRDSPYACECKENCLPDGLVDISSCYYGFPIALSKPHFSGVDAEQKQHFEGMKYNPEIHESRLDLEPSTGVPVSLKTNIQVNIAVRTSAGNPLTSKLKNKVLPLIWVSLFCKEPAADILMMLRLRFVIAPPLIITVTVILFIAGFILGAQGAYRFWRPKYRLIEPPIPVQKPRRRKSNIAVNMSDNIAFKDDEDLAKEAVSLLAIREEDHDIIDLIISD